MKSSPFSAFSFGKLLPLLPPSPDHPVLVSVSSFVHVRLGVGFDKPV